jgi:RND superfamily putative drug exporter
VLLDTLVVRSLLVPAAGYDIGRLIWWPSRLSRSETSAAPSSRIQVAEPVEEGV